MDYAGQTLMAGGKVVQAGETVTLDGATGEIFIQLTLVSIAFKHLVMPISLAIAALMGIVVISYRQTVRAYPSGGGAYIVSKENLGIWAALR